MSASRERKKRQEYFANGGVDKKAVKEAEQKAANRKSNIMYGSLAIALVIITACLLVYNSGILQRKSSAVTVGDVTYTAADAAFYYNESYLNLYNTLVSQYGAYGPSMMGLDTSISLKDQKAFGSTAEDAKTWDEYFKDQAVETMRFVAAATAAAEDEGYSITAEDEAYIADRIEDMKTAAKANGLSYKQYLAYSYGSLMTPSCFEKNLDEYTLATSYGSAYSDSLEYTADQVKAVYEGNTNGYDSVSYIRIALDATPAYDEEFNTLEYTDEEIAAGWEKTQAAGKALLEAYKAGEDLEEAAKAYDFATYYTNDAVPFSDADYVNWCFEAGRKAGDIKLFENDEYQSSNLVVFQDRYLDESKTVDVRHILITTESVAPADGADEPTNEQLKAKAEEIYAMWDGTEEHFIQLAKEYSKDSNAALGGIYTGVYEGQMVDTYNDWIFDASRKSGDSDIIETGYGYHILYFVGDNHPAWYLEAENTLLTADYNEWQKALVDELGEPTIHEKGMGYVS